MARRVQPRFGLFEFVVGALFCVGFPGLTTAIAPVSWIELHRADQRVDAVTRTCAFFVIPYRTQQLGDVRSVSTSFRQGGMQHRRPGEKNDGRQESEGTLLLHGPQAAGKDGQTIQVSVSPASYKAVEAKIQAFLADPTQPTLTLFTVANWKFGVFISAPLSLLTVFFVVCWSIWFLQLLASPFRNFFSVDRKQNAEAVPERDQDPDRS